MTEDEEERGQSWKGRRESREREGILRRKAKNVDKRRKSCCFKSVLLKEDVLSPGIVRGSHRTRDANSLTSVKQGQFQICNKTPSFFFTGTIRLISCPPYILCLSHLLPSAFLPSSVLSKNCHRLPLPTAELFFHAFILIAKWFELCL